MLGVYEGFPENIHVVLDFNSSLDSKKLQQKLVLVLQGLNRKQFRFEDVGSPSVPECTVIFEIGIADSGNFNYLDLEEAKRVLDISKKRSLSVMDFFWCIRYYKALNPKKRPLKFDYYLVRSIFNELRVEFQAFHERGPRYISPQDLITFITNKANEASAKPILKPVENE